MPKYAYEDFEVGTEFALGPRVVTEAEIIEFASEFDDQPHHTDPDFPAENVTGGLIASGWHTCCITMRMMCDAFILDSTSQGAPGIEAINWHQPVRPGDTLSGRTRVVEARVSKSKSHLGILKLEHEVKNQHGDVVCTMDNTSMLELRNPVSPDDNGGSA